MIKRILFTSFICCFSLVCVGESELVVSGGRFYEYSLKATLSSHDITNKRAIGVCYVQFFDEVLAPLKSMRMCVWKIHPFPCGMVMESEL